MKKKTKRNLIEIAAIGLVFLSLYLTGLHTEVIGIIQRGVLATGIMNPEIEVRDGQSDDKIKTSANLTFRLVNQNGETIMLEEFNDKVIFMNLWATWCPPCIAEMPTIEQLHKSVKNKDIELIMISLDDDFQKAIEFRDRKGYNFDIYQPESELPEMYKSSSIPTTYVIDKNGRLVMTHRGMADYSTDKFVNYLIELQE